MRFSKFVMTFGRGISWLALEVVEVVILDMGGHHEIKKNVFSHVCVYRSTTFTTPCPKPFRATRFNLKQLEFPVHRGT